MRRREAIKFLLEISNHLEATPVTCVYLKPRHSESDREDFELHVKTNQDTLTRQAINNSATKLGLNIRDETNGFIIIYSSEKKMAEITA